MSVFYLDTSAVVKRYRVEAGTEVMDALLDAAQPGERLVTSFLTVLEVTSAVLRLQATGRLDEAITGELLAQFHHDLRDRFEVWPVDDACLLVAVQVVERHRLRAADAIHLATALNVEATSSSPLQDVPSATSLTTVLVASDRELFTAAHAEGLIALDPTEAVAANRLVGLRATSREG